MEDAASIQHLFCQGRSRLQIQTIVSMTFVATTEHEQNKAEDPEVEVDFESSLPKAHGRFWYFFTHNSHNLVVHVSVHYHGPDKQNMPDTVYERP